MSRLTGENLDCLRGGRWVFAKLSFDLGAGDAIVLTGPNGSGKSSLLRVLTGLLRPAGGTLAWNGEEIGRDPGAYREQLSYLGHQDAIKPVLSVAEHVSFWADLLNFEPAAGKAALDRLGLSALTETPARYLSSGQRRRLALARVLAAGRPLWLLDEPSVGIDKANLGALVEAIEDHRRAGGLVVLATHQDLALRGAELLDLAQFAAPAGMELAE